jgi:hypothetical protein
LAGTERARPGGVPDTVPSNAVSETNGTLNSRIYAHRVHGSGTISKIQIRVNASSGNICVGVYSCQTANGIANAIPGSRKATSGSVACPTGVAEVSLGGNVDVVEGDWFAIMADNGTASFFYVGAGGASDIFKGKGGFTATAGTTLPLPSSLTIANWESKVYLMNGVA